MNSTIYTEPMPFINNSMTTTVESWFIFLDILAILCDGLIIIFTIIFLFIIVLDKTCYTVRMMLVANIFLTGLIFGCAHFAINIVVLQNDLKQIQYQDLFCIFRGYLSYASCASYAYSYVISAVYQYIMVVYPTRLFWQTARVQILIIIFAWILAFVYPFSFMFTGKIIYNVDNQVCQVPIRSIFSILYISNFIFMLPMSLVMFIYWRLVRFVRGMNQHVTPAKTLFRAQRDLKVVRRIVILIHILLICGFPMTLFVFLSFINLAPKYHFRIGFSFVNVSILITMIVLLQFTDSLKASVIKLIRGRQNMVIPTVVRQPTGAETKMSKKESMKMPNVKI